MIGCGGRSEKDEPAPCGASFDSCPAGPPPPRGRPPWGTDGPVPEARKERPMLMNPMIAIFAGVMLRAPLILCQLLAEDMRASDDRAEARRAAKR